MQYYAPKHGRYESGLTAKIMYSIVDGLIKKHVTQDDISRLNQPGALGLTKLWDKPEIRRELEEFVDSYFFSDFKETFLGFKEIVNVRDGELRKRKLEDYRTQLEQKYGSKEEADRDIDFATRQIRQRYDRISIEISKLRELKNTNPLVRSNTVDGFSHVTSIYGRIYPIMSYLGIS